MQVSKYNVRINPYSLSGLFKVRQGAKFLSIEEYNWENLVLIVEEDPEAPEIEMEVRYIYGMIPDGFSYLGTYEGDVFYASVSSS